MIGIKFDSISAKRFDSLCEQNPQVTKWPVFLHLVSVRSGKGQTIDFSPEDFDAVTTFLRLLSVTADISEEDFAKIIDRLVLKIGQKGGPKCPFGQMIDMMYESHLQIFLQQQMAGFVQFPDNDLGTPDGIFQIELHYGTEPLRVALEYKNRKQHTTSEIELTNRICSYIGKAVKQHRKRANSFDDLVIFIDLPLSVGLESPQYLLKTLANVWHQIEKRQIKVPLKVKDAKTREVKVVEVPISQNQIIFTMSTQSNMLEIVCNKQEMTYGLQVFEPLVTKEELTPIARILFLNFLFRNSKQAPNIANWSRKAHIITDAHEYLIQHSAFS